MRGCTWCSFNIVADWCFLPYWTQKKARERKEKVFFGVRRSTFTLRLPNIVYLGFRQRGTHDCSNQTPSLCVLMLHGGPTYTHILKTLPHLPIPNVIKGRTSVKF